MTVERLKRVVEIIDGIVVVVIVVVAIDVLAVTVRVTLVAVCSSSRKVCD